MMKREQEDKRSEEQAVVQLESIKEMVATLREASDKDDGGAREEAEQTIHEDPLSVEVRTDWHNPGESSGVPTEYRILLCTGGPAVQIVGELDEYGQPTSAKIEHQDWFMPWTEYRIDSEDEEIVIEYVRCFWFGEGS
jgi:hypothetical protein